MTRATTRPTRSTVGLRARAAASAVVLVASLGAGLAACGGDDGGGVRDDGDTGSSGSGGSPGSGSGTGSETGSE